MNNKRHFYNVKEKQYQNGEKLTIVYSTSVEYGHAFDRGVRGHSETPENSALSSQKRTKQTIIDLSKNNNWEYFITITFDKEKIDRYNYDIITKKLSQKINNIKKSKCPNLSYIIVPELHKDGAFHFHGLFSNVGDLKIIDSGKKSQNQTIFNLPDFNLGFTSATKVVDTKKVSYYISKYITKELMNHTFNKKRYWRSKDLLIPKEKVSLLSNDTLTTFEDVLTKRASHSTTYNIKYSNENNMSIKYFYE